MRDKQIISIAEQAKRIWRYFTYDPRHYQISILSGLIAIGVFVFDFGLPLWHVAGCVGGALMAQLAGDKLTGRAFEPRSALITSLSLTLLLRTGSVWLSLAAGIIAIGSKYLIRVRGKHIFNPANFALVLLALGFTSVWVSPGQWGTAGWLAILLVALGGIVTGKAKRWDISIAFLAAYAALIFGRALWLGDPLTIPLHQMQSGALLIFAFFMISDPKTTPNARAGRVAYAGLAALAGFIIQFAFYNSAGVLYALILTAPLVPLFDKVFKDRLYQWPKFQHSPKPLKGETYVHQTQNAA